MRKIVVATHGELAFGLKDSAKLIVGNLADDIITYSLKPGESATDFANEIKSIMDKSIDREFVILTDLYGASVFNAFTYLHELDNFYLFTGTNLGLLLSVILTNKPFTKEICKDILEESKSSMIFFEGFDIESEDNDF